jgi:hypothetical protein
MIMKSFPTQQELLELFDLKDGVLYWKTPRQNANRIKPGDRAGSISKRAYLQTTIGGSLYLNHRLIFMMHYGWVPPRIDHKDGDKLNNRPENLRAADASQNRCNIGPYANNTSGHKGVSPCKESGKWIASIQKDGRYTKLGRYDDPNDAAAAYAAAAAKLHGEFARTI